MGGTLGGMPLLMGRDGEPWTKRWPGVYTRTRSAPSRRLLNGLAGTTLAAMPSPQA